MSVRKGDQKPGHLLVLDDAMDLCTHTLQLCKNEKYFPKSQRWLFTSKIANEAVDVLTNIRKANATLLDGSEDRYRYRRERQTAAHANLGALYALIDVAYNMNSGLGDDQVKYWTELVRNTMQRYLSSTGGSRNCGQENKPELFRQEQHGKVCGHFLRMLIAEIHGVSSII